MIGSVILAVLACVILAASGPAATVKVSARPMHAGRISPMLFGNFIELLDDLVPGMWAEMLNDRSFEGVTKRSAWCYYDGKPNICDREWTGDFSYETKDVFNSARSVRIKGGASISQSGLAVRKGMTYSFSGYLRADPGLKVRVALKTMLPKGEWMELGWAELPKLSGDWKKYEARIVSSGTTDRAVFEIEVTGDGDLWADKLSLMPADNGSDPLASVASWRFPSGMGWRRDVVDAIRELRPGIIRWGGSVCDPGGYRWKDGIGDPDLRVPFPNKVWGRIDSNDVGVDEFCRFCELVEAEPLVCISFSDGSASAADLVQYCNGDPKTDWGAKRAANGHAKPYHVKYWQLGNELGDESYINALPEFCKVMKQADPSISLMSSSPSQALLDRVGKDIAYISPHHYTPDLSACESDFKNLSAMIRNTPGCEKVRIAVTEWNITGGAWGLGRGKLMTLDAALQNARYLNLLMRYSNVVDIACRSNMTNSLGSGVIETSEAGLLKRPSYYPMKLYADHARPIPHAVEGAPEGVDIAACASEDGKSVCIFAVNTTTEPVELALDSTLRPVGGETVCDTEDQRQADVMNHWDAPDRIRAVKLNISDGKITLPALSVSAIECR